MTEHDYAAQARTASGLNVLLGIWLIISPWIFGYAALGPAPLWNSVATGALVMILAASRYAQPHTGSGLSWTNLILGLWTIASPWVFMFNGREAAFLDNVAIGVATGLLALWSGSATSLEDRRHRPMAPI